MGKLDVELLNPKNWIDLLVPKKSRAHSKRLLEEEKPLQFFIVENPSCPYEIPANEKSCASPLYNMVPAKVFNSEQVDRDC